MYRTKMFLFSVAIVAMVTVQVGAAVPTWTITQMQAVSEPVGGWDSVVLNTDVLNAINIGGRDFGVFPPNHALAGQNQPFKFPSVDVTINGTSFKGMGPGIAGTHTANGVTISYDAFTADPIIADPGTSFSSNGVGGGFTPPVDNTIVPDLQGDGLYNLVGTHLFTSGDDLRNFPVTISGLVVGNEYEVQLFVGTGGGNRTSTYYLDTVAPSQSSGPMETLPAGFPVESASYSAVARFVADAGVHSILMGDGATGRTIISAISVSGIVPEPTSLTLFCIVGMALTCVRRTKS